jgi:hypothetical protein
MAGLDKHLYFFLALVLLLSGVLPAAAEECGACHRITVRGGHAGLSCADCHGSGGDKLTLSSGAATGCTACHAGMQGVLAGPMALRGSERAFVAQAFARHDARFFEKNCSSCHLADCLDCHGADGHPIARPQKEDCHTCHRGYFVGADYWGLAPREDSLRYQRGAGYGGEKYLKMRPDVHAEAGLDCGDCHTMTSLAAGSRSALGCRDCHQPDLRVIEHGIAAHLEQLECYACHSAWGAQEYGSFFLRVGANPVGDIFQVRREPGSEYIRSAYLRRQDGPPLGRNAAGRISPIRPQFVAYYSDLRDKGGAENVLAAAQWKAFFPHTIRRGTATCDGCHDDPRRFLLEAENRRIYLPGKDGMTLSSFWDSREQTLSNGTFVTAEEFVRLSRRSPAYVRGYVEKWKNLVKRVEDSSRP